jgi:hypothetical protein
MHADYFSLSAPFVHKVSRLQFLVVKLFSSVLGFTFPSIPSTFDSAHSASIVLACFVLFGELDLLESSLTSHPAALTVSLKCCSLWSDLPNSSSFHYILLTKLISLVLGSLLCFNSFQQDIHNLYSIIRFMKLAVR